MKTQKTLKSALLASAALALIVPTMVLAAIKAGDTLGTDEAAIINALEIAGYEQIEVEFEVGIFEAEGWDPVTSMEMEFEIDPETGLVSAVSVDDEDEADEDDDDTDTDKAEDDDMEDADDTNEN